MLNTPDLVRACDVEFEEALRKGLRGTAMNISLLSTRDDKGRCYGLAMTAAVPFSSAKPSVLIAVSHSASAYPVIRSGKIFCLNQITSNDLDLLNKFSRSDLRASRFSTGKWRAGIYGLPYLKSAIMSYFCHVQSETVQDDHTVFIGRIEGVKLGSETGIQPSSPLIWINGGPARLAGREYA